MQILPKEVVIDLRYESLTALEQKLEASVGTNHHVPTKKQESERSRNMFLSYGKDLKMPELKRTKHNLPTPATVT
jgi:hypothetical protein